MSNDPTKSIIFMTTVYMYNHLFPGLFSSVSLTEANGVSTHSTNKVNGHTVVMENLTE